MWKSGDKVKTLEEVFGMTEEQLKAQITGSASKTDLDAVKTEVTNGFESIKSMIKGLEGKGDGNGNGGGNGTGEHVEPVITQNKIPSVLENEDAAFAARLGPTFAMTLQTRADYVRKDVLAEKPYYKIAAIKKEVDEILKAQPLEALVNPLFVENCYNSIVGRHHDDIERDKSKGSGDFFVEPAGGAAGGVSSTSTGGETKLTAEEDQYCKKFGITPEQYTKSKKSMKFMGA